MKKVSILLILCALSTSGIAQYEKQVENIDEAYRMGDYKKASTENTQFRKKFSKDLGEDNKWMVMYYLKAARNNNANGYLIDFENHMTKAREKSELVFGLDSEDHAKTLLEISDLLIDYGNFNRANNIVQEAEAILEKLGDVPNDYRAKIDFNYASIYSGKGFYQQALDFLEERIEYFKGRAISKETYVDKKGKLKTRNLDDAEVTQRFEEYTAVLALIARTYWKMGDFNAADSAFVKAQAWIKDTKELKKSSFESVLTNFWHAQMLDEYGLKPKPARELYEDTYYKFKIDHNESHYLFLNIYEAMLKNYLVNNDEARYKNLKSEYENVITRFFTTKSMLSLNLEMVELVGRLDRERTRNLEARTLKLLYSEDILPAYHPKRIELLDFVYHVAITDKNYQDAEKYLTEMLDVKKVLYGEESPEYHISKIKLARYYVDYTNRYTEAEEIYKESFFGIVKPQIKNLRYDYVEILNGLAKYYELGDEYQKSSETLDEALFVSRTLYDNTDKDYGVELEKIANLQIRIGEYEKADENISQALEILRNERNQSETAILYVKALETSARLKSIQGYLGGAEDDLRDAGRFFRRADNLIGYDALASSVDVADLNIKFGKYKETEELLLSAIAEYEKIYGPDSRNLIPVLVNTGYLMETSGDFAEAAKYSQRANKIALDTYGENSTKTATTLTLFAQIDAALGDYEQAERNIQEAIRIQENQFGRDHIDVAKSLSSLGLIKLYKNDSPEVIEPIFDEARAIVEGKLGNQNPLYADLLTSLAEVYIGLDKQPEAFDALNKAYAIWDLTTDGKKNVNKANIFVLKGDVYYYLKNYAEAEINYLEAQKLYDRFFTESHPDYIKVVSKLSKVYYMLGDARKAKLNIDKALDQYAVFIESYFPALSEREKAKYWNTIKPDYEFYNTLALELREEFPQMQHAMMDNALATKAILLNSSLKIRERILNSGDEVLVSKYNEWLNKKEYLTQVLSMSREQLEENQIDPIVLSEEVEAVEREISEKSEIFKASFDSNTISWDMVRDELKSNEVAIEMVRFRYFEHVFTDSVIYAGLWVKGGQNQKEPGVIVINDGVKMETRYFKYYRNAIIHQFEDKFSFQTYWEPIVNQVGGSSTIFFSADGVYNQINLESIPTGDGKYVIDNSNIIVITNTKDIYVSNHRQKSEHHNDATMVGNPTFYTDAGGSSTVGQLPGTEKEVAELNTLLRGSGWKIDSYVEDQATEDRIKRMNNPKVFHIATHGFFTPQAAVEANQEVLGRNQSTASNNPLLRTGLMLTGAGDLLDKTSFNYNIENGILTAYEAMNLNLDDTDLVVLSACETGLGDLSVGEGVYGLQRAFIVAGAKTLIMSMFKVSDEATQKLMVNFYQKWLDTGDKRKAFVDAKKELRNEFQEPIYWGAFIMIGLD